MKTKARITVKRKTFPYTLEKTSKGTVILSAPAAHINQEFLAEDVSEIILDLPHLITAEQEYKKKQSEVIRFRVSGKDKQKIEQHAVQKGYDSVSSYLRDLALQQ